MSLLWCAVVRVEVIKMVNMREWWWWKIGKQSNFSGFSFTTNSNRVKKKSVFLFLLRNLNANFYLCSLCKVGTVEF